MQASKILFRGLVYLRAAKFACRAVKVVSGESIKEMIELKEQNNFGTKNNIWRLRILVKEYICRFHRTIT